MSFSLRHLGDGPPSLECRALIELSAPLDRDAVSEAHYLVGRAIAGGATEVVLDLRRLGRASDVDPAQLDEVIDDLRDRVEAAHSGFEVLRAA